MNEFSILCRVLGSLYYRQPQDPLLVPLFTLIREGKLSASWYWSRMSFWRGCRKVAT